MRTAHFEPCCARQVFERIQRVERLGGPFTPVFRTFGWIVVITSVVLFLLPWRLHHRFGQRTIPLALARLKLYALGTFGLGAFILFATLA